jgi:hypothetical protein
VLTDGVGRGLGNFSELVEDVGLGAAELAATGTFRLGVGRGIEGAVPTQPKPAASVSGSSKAIRRCRARGIRFSSGLARALPTRSMYHGKGGMKPVLLWQRHVS